MAIDWEKRRAAQARYRQRRKERGINYISKKPPSIKTKTYFCRTCGKELPPSYRFNCPTCIAEAGDHITVLGSVEAAIQETKIAMVYCAQFDSPTILPAQTAPYMGNMCHNGAKAKDND